MDNENLVLGDEKKQFKNMIKSKIASKFNSNKGLNISDLSKNIKENLSKTIQHTSQQTTEMINSIKKVNIRALEKHLHIENAELMVSNKKNYIYRDSDKMVIVDRDMWGEPYMLTIKTNDKIVVKCIKFFNGQPFFYPIFNEKTLQGELIFANETNLYYQDKHNIMVVNFKGDRTDIVRLKVSDSIMSDKSKVLRSIDDQMTLYKNKKLAEFIKQHEINPEDILILTKGYVVTKVLDSYSAYLLDDECNLLDEVQMHHLPDIQDNAYKILFSEDIYSYIKAKNYRLEDFKQNEDFVEYYESIGEKKICVLRYKID